MEKRKLDWLNDNKFEAIGQDPCVHYKKNFGYISLVIDSNFATATSYYVYFNNYKLKDLEGIKNIEDIVPGRPFRESDIFEIAKQYEECKKLVKEWEILCNTFAAIPEQEKWLKNHGFYKDHDYDSAEYWRFDQKYTKVILNTSGFLDFVDRKNSGYANVTTLVMIGFGGYFGGTTHPEMIETIKKEVETYKAIRDEWEEKFKK